MKNLLTLLNIGGRDKTTVLFFRVLSNFSPIYFLSCSLWFIYYMPSSCRRWTVSSTAPRISGQVWLVVWVRQKSPRRWGRGEKERGSMRLHSYRLCSNAREQISYLKWPQICHFI